MNLSPHFSLEELTTTKALDLSEKNFHLAAQEPILSSLKRVAVLMEWVREVLGGRPLKITSGYRCDALNVRVKGSPTSQHCRGEACDFLAGDLNQDGVMDAEDIRLAVRKLGRAAREQGLRFGQLLAEFKFGCIHISVGSRCQVASGEFNEKTQKWDVVNWTDKEIMA